MTLILDCSTSDTNATIRQVPTPSLGDHSYIVTVGSEAVAIDVQRDLDRFDGVIDEKVSLVAVLETHIHNDYVSGGKRLADAHGARYVLPANSRAPYEHEAMGEGDEIAVGPWSVRAVHTPGHTFNHQSYVLESPAGPVAAFTGGSMLVGAVGRSDLLGAQHTDSLLAHQYESVGRLASGLTDPTIVAPTHGAGSFCSASTVADTTSTVALERLRNPALLAPSLDVFAAGQLAGYRIHPAYYRHMAPANLTPMGAPDDRPLPAVTDVHEIDGAAVADVRPFAEFAAGHLPGSISVPLSNDTAVYLGWTLDWGSPLALVGTSDQVSEARTQLARIGWDDIVGWIDPSSLDRLADGQLVTTAVRTWADVDVDGRTVLDVRDPVEHADGVIPGAVAVHFADFARNPEGYATGDVVIHCQSGYRAAVASGFAEHAGATVTVVSDDLAKVRDRLVTPTAG